MRNIFLILITVIITVVCVKNPQSVQLNFLGESQVALWKLLLAFFITGIVFVSLLKIGKKKQRAYEEEEIDESEEENSDRKSQLSDEDREFLS
ncbi:lipopolysaccharide assembly protein LapA domain-containing protein [Sphingobacterium sp. G1-14]|uniref:lipopolysaccharide assembly protein LapA domain-containing protein n=1 Tax=Sphingobacterium sp. G1-14 TaxID=2003121 RepID=UPI000B48D714|nr:lipopolysaccharide assembly protein LapA domain-containing protein [Sphingobacterium sp. G1-14]